MSIANKVLLSLALGIVFGLLLNWTGAVNIAWIDSYVLNGVFHVIGTLFINALKMLVVPLVLFSIIPGIIGIGDVRLLGRIGTKTFVLYMLTTAIAITVAVGLAALVKVGKGMDKPPTTLPDFSGKEPMTFIETLIGIIPENIIQAMVNGDMLAIIFFAIFFGVGLLTIAKESPDLIRFIDQMNATIMRMVTMVMWFAPYAVFCLVAKAISELGFDLLQQLLGYFLVLTVALAFHVVVTQMGLLKLLTGLSPITFLKKIRTAQLFAFSTSSSGATIPVTLQSVEKRMGVDNSVASFGVPFGATINMDGTAMMQGVATVFIANLYAIDLSFADYLTVIATAVLASVGTAAVPAVGTVMLILVFDQVGLPVEGIAIILGVDRLLDMMRTAVNVTGDAAVTTIVAKSENRIDLDVFNDPNAGIIDDDDLPHMLHLDEPERHEDSN